MPRSKSISRTRAMVVIVLGWLGLAACAGATPAGPMLPMTVAPAASEAWRAGPINTKPQAAIAAQGVLGTSPLRYATGPQIIFVGQMSFDEARRRVRFSEGPTSGEDVWLVVFEGDYQIISPIMPAVLPGVTATPFPTPLPAVHGCVFVILTVADGTYKSWGTMTSCAFN